MTVLPCVQKNVFLPMYPAELRIPLSCKLSCKSHCAIGTTNATASCSDTWAKEQGMTMSISSILNFPNPVAVMASSKLEGLETEEKKIVFA